MSTKLFLDYPDRYYPGVDIDIGKLHLGVEHQVPATFPDRTVRRLWEFGTKAEAVKARGQVSAVLQKHDAAGATLRFG